MGRFLIIVTLFICHVSFCFAQNGRVARGNCTPPPPDEVAGSRSASPKRLPSIITKWDANRVYRQLVVLISYSDTDFLMEKPRETYDSIFNYPGFNERQGPGCVAEYYREQSGGLLNIQFDVVGPIKVSSKAQPYDNPTENSTNYGSETFQEAVKKLIDKNPDMEFAPYDWNNNGYVNQVIIVVAGYCGNIGIQNNYGYLWPNTSTFSTVTAPDGTKINQYSASAELWTGTSSCGIGTICHEFTHCLGLPDIYPTNGWAFSAVDEWDLMDGGNFTNYGWCPPNFSALEKMLLGWLTPTDLDAPKTITGMKPVSEGGEVFRVKHTDTEYLLLENHRWSGWDSGLPGEGLLIVHVNYVASRWNNNTVNNVTNQLYYDVIHADGMDYESWTQYVLDTKASTYKNAKHMNNRFLSTSTYPWSTDSTETVNNAFTDETVPAAQMITANEEGSKMLQKPITDIVRHEDGTVSFLFMGGDSIFDAIRETTLQRHSTTYDLQGRRVGAPNGAMHRRIYLIQQEDGTIRKVFK